MPANLVNGAAILVGGLGARSNLALLPDPQRQIPVRGAPLGSQEAAIGTESHADNVLQTGRSAT